MLWSSPTATRTRSCAMGNPFIFGKARGSSARKRQPQGLATRAPQIGEGFATIMVALTHNVCWVAKDKPFEKGLVVASIGAKKPLPSTHPETVQLRWHVRRTA